MNLAPLFGTQAPRLEAAALTGAVAAGFHTSWDVPFTAMRRFSGQGDPTWRVILDAKKFVWAVTVPNRADGHHY